MTKLIPTSYKLKIPKNLSWPIRSKMLSKALEGVPQYDSLSISFSDCSTLFKSELQNLIRKQGTIPVLRVRYTNYKPNLSASRYLIERGCYDESWNITVYPVPREKSAKIREEICEFGFSAMRKWLTKQRPPIWYDGRKSLSLGYNLEKGELLTEES